MAKGERDRLETSRVLLDGVLCFIIWVDLFGIDGQQNADWDGGVAHVGCLMDMHGRGWCFALDVSMGRRGSKAVAAN